MRRNVLETLVKLAVPLALCFALAGPTAYACKENYCSGSKAPTSLNQVGGAQNYLTPPPGGGAPSLPCDQQSPPMLESPPPSFDLVGAIQTAKDQLTAEGADLTGNNCGQIVERAVTILGNGAGLLSKNYGTAYNGHSVDYIVMPDGSAWDAVIDCGGTNTAGIGGSGCCAPLPATTCQPNSRYMPYP
ncbi:MAG: hypothetical protein EPN97_06995 [Alphaproteobacteria bacterium]|nr:MAG: hypothetical protein EPN97_06995 [Alphaproteobacteria bacterium]